MRIGIDLGGTKIEGVVLGADKTILKKKRIHTPRDSYAKIVAALAGLIQELESEGEGQSSIGIGTPGTFSPHTGLMKNSNTVVLNGKNLKLDLEATLDRHIFFANDANCLTLSEAVDGAAMGARSVFGVIIGTGTGGGLVFDGQIVEGVNSIAGEWGHNPLPYATPEDLPGRACYCGKIGCIETYLCGAGLSALYETISGESVSAETVGQRLRESETRAIEALSIYADRLARALSSVINVFDPEVIVFGGGLSNLENLLPQIKLALPRYVFSDHVATELKLAEYGDSSGVRGAAWLPP
ncbi:MAG: ROK family protein [Pseudomonadota bacterium]